VHHRPWVNFGENRDQALQLAVQAGKADWVLFIDADEELLCTDSSFVNHLQRGVSYTLEKHHGSLRYAVPSLTDISENTWTWVSPVHEYLAHKSGSNRKVALKDPAITYHSGEGARSVGKTAAQKFLGDAAILEKHLESHPGEPRTLFYLAQSYRDAGEHHKARDFYLLRAKSAAAWIEETFCAQYQVGRMSCLLAFPHDIIVSDLIAAYNLRPTRAEPLHRLAVHCRQAKRWGEGVLYATAGAALPPPKDALFVEHDIYLWRLLDELSVSAYWAGMYEISREASLKILSRHEHEGVQIPPEALDRIHKNLAFAESKLSGA
jgi:hypothetical protein